MKQRYLVHLAVLALVAMPAHVAAQARAPAARATAGEVARKEPMFTTLYTLCRTRENELLQYNNMIFDASLELGREKDAAKQEQLIDRITTSRRLLAEAEGSWQRMSCMGLLHNTRSEGR